MKGELTLGGVYWYGFSGLGGAGGTGNGIGFGRAVSPSTMFTKQYSISAMKTNLQGNNVAFVCNLAKPFVVKSIWINF